MFCIASRLRAATDLGLLLGLMLAVMALLVGPSRGWALTVEEIVSPKGIKAWLVEEHSVPLIAVKFAFAGGASQDAAGQEEQAIQDRRPAAMPSMAGWRR